MENKKLEATLETRTSASKGTTYTCIVIKLTPSYEKLVFLNKAELEIIKNK